MTCIVYQELKAMKKVDRDPFSNGTEHMRFEESNCDKCWKSSHIKRGSDPDYPDWTPLKCAIQRDIFTRMVTDKQPISQRTIDICESGVCPFRQEKRNQKKYEKKKNEPKLF